MRALLEIARLRELVVLEDACQAHGAARDGLRAGSAGDMAAFSFYPSKNLGAMGDAGAFVTDSADLASRVRALREHGQTAPYRSAHQGYTARLDTFQALVLLHKLPHVADWNAERARAAAYYSSELDGVGDLQLPPVADSSSPVWHLYVVRTRDPERLREFLRGRGIAAARHYPELPHLSPAFSHLGFEKGAFPIAEAVAREGLSLPLFAGISEEQLARVCAAVRGYFAGG
jgi:dTDP-4-amino-4,6-dideoxygalactose transaminase